MTITDEMVERAAREPTYSHYRFIYPDGRSTNWRRIPKNGITGVQYTRAPRDFGVNTKFSLQLKYEATLSGKEK